MKIMVKPSNGVISKYSYHTTYILILFPHGTIAAIVVPTMYPVDKLG